MLYVALATLLTTFCLKDVPLATRFRIEESATPDVMSGEPEHAVPAV